MKKRGAFMPLFSSRDRASYNLPSFSYRRHRASSRYNGPMTTKPRWFRFSLRTMFVLVTALCCFLAWQMSIVRQRRAVLANLRSRPAIQITTAAVWEKNLSPPRTPPRRVEIPLLRRWLGDEAIQEIGYGRGFHNLSKAELARLARLFPEAEIREFEMPLEPCHPGCFPRGTPVETPAGMRSIQNIRAGDELIAILPSGQMVTASVQSVFVTTNRLWQVETEEGVLLTTQTQPLCLAVDETVEAGRLQPGDRILCRRGGELRPVIVRRVRQTRRVEKVFNLVLGNCEVFIAGGYLARSKPPAKVPDP